MQRSPVAKLGIFLYQAVQTNQPDRVKSYLEQGVHPDDYIAPDGNTALHAAVIANEPSLVALLLARGASTVIQNTAKKQALKLAIDKLDKDDKDDKGLWDCTFEFVKHYAQHPTKDKTISSMLGQPLLYAIEQKKWEYVELLLKAGAITSWARTNTGHGPLHLAVLANKPDVVELLLQSGADATLRYKMNTKLPLELAIEMDHSEVGRLACISAFARHNLKNPQREISALLGGDALLDAISTHDDPYILLLVVASHATYYSAYQKDTGNTVLHRVALENSSLKIVDSLLSPTNKSLTSRNNGNEAPALSAAKERHWDIVKKFARYQNDMSNARQYDEALILAVRANRFDVAACLLKAKSNPNNTKTAVTECGNSALHEAAMRKQSFMIGLLRAYGANDALPNIATETPIRISAALNDFDSSVSYIRPLSDKQLQLACFTLLLAQRDNQTQTPANIASLPIEILQHIMNDAFDCCPDFSQVNKQADVLLIHSIRALYKRLEKERAAQSSLHSLGLSDELKLLVKKLHTITDHEDSSEEKAARAKTAITTYCESLHTIKSASAVMTDINLLIKFHILSKDCELGEPYQLKAEEEMMERAKAEEEDKNRRQTEKEERLLAKMLAEKEQKLSGQYAEYLTGVEKLYAYSRKQLSRNAQSQDPIVRLGMQLHDINSMNAEPACKVQMMIVAIKACLDLHQTESRVINTLNYYGLLPADPQNENDNRRRLGR